MSERNRLVRGSPISSVMALMRDLSQCLRASRGWVANAAPAPRRSRLVIER